MRRLLVILALVVGPCTPVVDQPCEAGKRWDGTQCVACKSMQECM